MTFTILILGIWVCATIGSAFTKDSDPFGAALAATLLIGFGYALTK